MRPRLCLAIVALFVAGCTEQEPLAPPFAGEWSARKMRCSGPRITIDKDGISAPGMPVNGLSFTSATVSGSTAHLVMELSASVRLVAGSPDPTKPRDIDDPRNFEILATMIANGDIISSSNVILRDKKTRQLRAAPADVLEILSLRRCALRGAQQTFRAMAS